MSKKDVIGIGAGGHAKVVVDAIRAQGIYHVAGMLEKQPDRRHSKWMGVPILGTDEDLPELRNKGCTRIFIGLGGVGNMHPRSALYDRVRNAGFEIIAACHPTAWVSPSASLDRATTILACAAVNADAILGEHVIVNTGAVVEHDCRIGHQVHIAPRAVLSGCVTVGDHTFIGAGACVRQGIHIGADAVIGMGAVVVHDVPDGATVVGVPARIRDS
jgi:UDP-perosamine 4-acetyltransferase